jgi:hypothetical protein
MEYQKSEATLIQVLLRGLSKNNHYHKLADIINGWRVHDDNIPVNILRIQKYFRSILSQNGSSNGNRNSSSYSGRQNNTHQYLGNVNAHRYHTTLQPSTSKHDLNYYVDADFAGLWNDEISSEPLSVKSRTGYIITFANCPVLWISKLQTEIALSTTEVEYIALSQAMRDLIPLRTLLSELSALTKLMFGSTTTHSTDFKDNMGCIELANAPKMRPRTKRIAIKYHHFRSHVANGSIPRTNWQIFLPSLLLRLPSLPHALLY